MNIVLFIHGKASAGKDYLVKALKYFRYLKYVEYFSNLEKKQDLQNLAQDLPSCFDTEEIMKMPFADEVRRELCRINPGVDFQRLCNDYEYKTKFRKELVEIGDGYRKERPDIWIEEHYNTLKKYCSTNNGNIICVPDMRYDTNDVGSEFDYSKDITTSLEVLTFRIKIEASLLTRLKRMSPRAIQNYVKYGMFNTSETAMDHLTDKDFDFVLDNDEQYSQFSFPSTYTSFCYNLFKLHDKIKEL